MPVRTIQIYEVSTGYISSGSATSVLSVSTLTFSDDDAFLDATSGADSGTAQGLVSSLGTVDSYTFVYDDNTNVGGVTMNIKTFYVTINGVQRAFIMGETGDDIPSATLGAPVVLNSFVTYTPVEYVDIPCFASGTLIDTPEGKIRIENVKKGDKIQTLENGVQTVRWAGKASLSFRDLLQNPDLMPICIEANAFGKGAPSAALFLSPQHRVLVSGWQVELAVGMDDALVAAKHLLSHPGVSQPHRDCGVTYHHILFDNHEIVMSNNLTTESILAAEGQSSEADAEIKALFPEFYLGETRKAAHPVLKKFEAEAFSNYC